MSALTDLITEMERRARARQEVLEEKARALEAVFKMLYVDIADDGTPSYNPDRMLDAEDAEYVAGIVRPFFADRFPKEGE